jgi:hypothetical protein
MGAELCGITTELYSAYVAYCGDVEMPPVSQRRFAELLHQLGHPAAASALSTVPRAIRARAASRNGSDIRLGLAVRGTPYA